MDLFAGTGAMGLEALSRGAKCCFFVDNGMEAVHLIRENVQLCALMERSRIIRGTVSSAISRLRSEDAPFDLIFMDPPYGKGYVEKTLQVIGPVARNDTLVVAEQHIKDRPPMIPAIWQKERERRYGDTLITVYSMSTIPQ